LATLPTAFNATKLTRYVRSKGLEAFNFWRALKIKNAPERLKNLRVPDIGQRQFLPL
jgi:hypothetical protein